MGHGEDASKHYTSEIQIVEKIMQNLHHTFGDNDLIVARRQLRAATGEAYARWVEIVERLETKRGWAGAHLSAVT